MASVVELILTAKNNASPEIKKLVTDVNSLDASVKSLSGLATAGFGMAGLAAAVSTVQQLGTAIAQTSQAGAEFTRLDSSFQKLSTSFGSNGTDIISAIESVTQGTLSQKTIMQQANNAMLLGVADTADEFETLSKIAVDRGRAMGISMEYAFESIVKGVGRLSPLILDNLGIVLDADTTYKKYAETIGKTADALSDAEKRQALLARLKEEVSDFDSTAVMDGAAAWERLTSSMTNAVAVAGAWINSNSLIIGAIQGTADSLDILAGRYSDNDSVRLRGLDAEKKRMEELLEMQMEHQRIVAGAQDMGIWNAFDNTEEAIQTTINTLAELEDKMDRIRKANAAQKDDMSTVAGYLQADALRQLDAEYSKISDTMVSKYAKAMGFSNDKARENIMVLVEQRGSWAAVIPTINSVVAAFEAAAQRMAAINSMIAGAISSIEGAAMQAYVDSGYNPAVIESYRALNTQVTAMSGALEEMDPINAKFLMKQVAEEGSAGFKAITEEANAAGKAIGGAGGATKSLTKEFQSLRGMVEGLVSGAMTDIGGADLSKFLPYEDAPAEDARRIASVMVEGWDSEWVGYFKEKFPDLFTKYMADAGGDIQKASALLLKDFQNGMRPELLDKGRIKELAKAMFLADAETSKMVDEIATELAKELNITIEEAKAAVGGAAGIKKKPLSNAETEKLLNDFKLAPKWDMADSKKKFMDAGKAAGVFDEDGRLMVDVGLNIEATTEDALKKAVTMQLSITGAMFTDKQQIKDWLESEMTTFLYLVPIASDLFAWRMEEIIKPMVGGAGLEVYPVSAQDSVWIAYYDTLRTRWGQFGVEIIPFQSTNEEVNPFSGLKDKLNETFSDPSFSEDAIFNLGANLGLAIFNDPESFSWQGRYIGILMINAFEEQNVGQLIANSISNQLTQAQKTFEVAARNSGKVWGSAFLSVVKENVPTELINILTDLVAPQVEQKQRRDRVRGGSE